MKIILVIGLLVVTPILLSGQRSNQDLITESKAKEAFQKRDFDKALFYFEKLVNIGEIKGEPKPIYTYNAALSAKNAGNHQKAAYYFRKSIDQNYGGSDAYYLLMREYFTLKDSISALETLKQGFEIYPDTTLILFELINYYLSIGNTDQSLIYLNMALDKDPNNPTLLFVLPLINEGSNDQKKDLNIYRKYLNTDPWFFDYHDR